MKKFYKHRLILNICYLYKLFQIKQPKNITIKSSIPLNILLIQAIYFSKQAGKRESSPADLL
ncbi:hypothetical protein OB13_01310 [Pontibacter sp. HJ8]